MMHRPASNALPCWALVVLLGVCACSSDKSDAKPTPTPAPPSTAKSEQSNEPQRPARSSVAATSPVSVQPEVEIDPARMPVEEDFIEEAKWRIGKNASLEKELNRIAAELKSTSK